MILVVYWIVCFIFILLFMDVKYGFCCNMEKGNEEDLGCV